MGLTIRNNLAAQSGARYLGQTQKQLQASSEKLTSGYRINRAADDAAGLAISEKMRSQIRGLTQASSNADNGINFCKTADGALEQVTNMIQRINELAVQAQDETISSDQQANAQAEVTSLIAEIDRIAGSSEFNGKKMLNGDLKGDGINFQVGYTANASDKINLKISDMTSSGLSLDSLDITDSDCLAIIKTALQTVTTQRANIGAVQNRLGYTKDNLDTMVENTKASESNIRDVDTAQEETNYAALQILYNSGITMLSNANQNQQSILNLLG